MKCLIADLVTELYPKYEETKRLAAPFLYDGSRKTDIVLTLSDETLNGFMRRAAEGVTVEQMENFALCQQFNRSAIPFHAMLIHSSALVYGGKAYLFSAGSGVGKSTHTRLWQRVFGSRVHVFNDDKPVVRLYEDSVVACGTPFDGGSGIALNENYPLGAIVFLERGEDNAVRVPNNREILQKLYFQTLHLVNAQTAELMLDNFEQLLHRAKFFVLRCNMEEDAVRVAYEQIVRQFT